MDRIQAIRDRLLRHLEASDIDVVDESHHHIGHAGAAGGAGHFAVRIVSGHFAGRSPIERHRLVYRALDDMMPAEIHALSIQAYTPEEQ